MSTKALRADRGWMSFRLRDTAMNEFDRVKAYAMLSGGVLFGGMLCEIWRRRALA